MQFTRYEFAKRGHVNAAFMQHNAGRLIIDMTDTDHTELFAEDGPVNGLVTADVLLLCVNEKSSLFGWLIEPVRQYRKQIIHAVNSLCEQGFNFQWTVLENDEFEPNAQGGTDYFYMNSKYLIVFNFDTKDDAMLAKLMVGDLKVIEVEEYRGLFREA